MKNIFTLLFLFSLSTAKAANYYFSAVSGNDAHSSAQARNASTPWKTIGKLNSFFSLLKPGDSVLLERGETFYGSIVIRKSGTAALPIVIGAYGTGSKPIITSLVTLTGWVSKGNGIWESYNSALGKTVNTVLINDEVQQIGRYPNSDAANKGYLNFESHFRENSITDNDLTSSTNWKGAEVVIRARRWILDRNKIQSYKGGKITYGATSKYRPKNNYGYFIENDIRTLDQFGEWYYNSSGKKLNIYFGSAAPSSYTVQTTTFDNLISSADNYNIVLDNLNIKGANENAIDIRRGSNMNIKNCDIAFSGGSGVTAYGIKYINIENCTISNSNNNGIDLGYSGNNAIIRNNKITNTSVFAGMGGSGDGKSFGIHSHGSNSIIEYNEIRNTGYVGITFGGDFTTVKNNLIDGYCTIKDDGSGIYAFTGSANTNFKGRKVIGNIVMNGVGAPEGVDENTPLVEGIYMDDNAAGVEISGNTIANIPGKGIFLHNARNMAITNNTVFNNKVQLSIVHDTKGEAVRNCIITKNNFFSKFSSQGVANFKSIGDDNNLIGRFDSNYYARPIDDRIIIKNSYVDKSGVSVSENLDLEGFKKKYNKDAASKRTAKQIASYRVNRLGSSNKIFNGTFKSNINGVFRTLCTTDWINSDTSDGGCIQVSPSAKNSSVYIKIGGLGKGKKYLLKYSVKSADNGNMTIGAFLRNDRSPYNSLTAIQTRKVSNAISENEILFSSSSNEDAATVVFMVNNKSKYFLDNVQLYEADATITNIDDSIRFVYNATQLSKTVSLPGKYVDAKNNRYSNSIVLQPYTSAVLIKNDNVTVANAAPSVNITSPVADTRYKGAATIFISADASDAHGTIKKVEFYVGTTLLHTEHYVPYTYSWQGVPAGNYTLTAKATNSYGQVTASKPVSVSVTESSSADKAVPKVKITSPAINAVFKASADINISADASVAAGKIKKVEFYVGSRLLQTVANMPYNWDWKKVRAGNYTITAVATDDKGNVATSESVTISVVSKHKSHRVTNSNAVSAAEDKNTNVVINDTLNVNSNIHALNLRKEVISKEVPRLFTMKIFPNPAVNTIKINIEGLQISNQKAYLSIRNLSGIAVKSIPVILSGKTIEADITSLRTGMYIVSIVSDHFIISSKLIKN
jgi:parallel beta-helix repeat protein